MSPSHFDFSMVIPEHLPQVDGGEGELWQEGICVRPKQQGGVCSAAVQPVSGAQPKTLELNSFCLSPSEFFFLLAEFFQVG